MVLPEALESLCLSDNPIGVITGPVFSSAPGSLKELELESCQLCDESVRNLVRCLPQLSSLFLGRP